jgi:hypothetical protein
LQGIDKRSSCAFAQEAAEFVHGNDHHLIAAVHGHNLRPFAPHAPHQFAETHFGILKGPTSRRARRLGRHLSLSRHTDYVIGEVVCFKAFGARADLLKLAARFDDEVVCRRSSR